MMDHKKTMHVVFKFMGVMMVNLSRSPEKVLEGNW